MKFASLALIPAFACFLGAQTTQTQSQTTQTTTTTATGEQVNLNGTLIDQGCYTTHTQHKETNSNDQSSTTTETTKVTTECPVTTTTTSFGLMTPEGRFVDASNARVVEMVKSNKQWNEDVTSRKPVRVRVVAMPNGEVMVIKEIKGQ